MSETKERPILFSAPMARAILDGRKTQTRRVVDMRRHGWPLRTSVSEAEHHADLDAVASLCPYGQPGDRLWVRETWALSHAWDKSRAGEMPCARGDAVPVYYRADGDDERRGRWHPSIHMPRWASRLTLEITGVRVERVQDISEEDARAEGVEDLDHGWRNYLVERESEGLARAFGSARESFFSLWEFINGAESWVSNPWVWVVEFRRVA